MDLHKPSASSPSLEIWVSIGKHKPLHRCIARCKGIGRIRHLDVTDLRVQEKFNNKLTFLHKVLGAENPTDLLTKYTNNAMLTMAIGKMGMRLMDGRSAIVPAALGTSANANA